MFDVMASTVHHSLPSDSVLALRSGHVQCQVPWHDGMDCAVYQQLPDHLRSADDIALSLLARDSAFRKCAGCNMLIEKKADGRAV